MIYDGLDWKIHDMNIFLDILFQDKKNILSNITHNSLDKLDPRIKQAITHLTVNNYYSSDLKSYLKHLLYKYRNIAYRNLIL